MKAAKSRMSGRNTRPDLASSFALPAKWDPAVPCERIPRDNFWILTSTLGAISGLRASILAPAFPHGEACSGCLSTWESVTRYRGGTVPDSHGVPALRWCLTCGHTFRRSRAKNALSGHANPRLCNRILGKIRGRQWGRVYKFYICPGNRSTTPVTRPRDRAMCSTRNPAPSNAASSKGFT